MPANNGRGGPIGALIRLLGAWRRRRAARRKIQSGAFIGLSDRMLADIGVRRADAHGALIGAMPLCRVAAHPEAPPRDATIHQPPQERRRAFTVVAKDLGGAT